MRVSIGPEEGRVGRGRRWGGYREGLGAAERVRGPGAGDRGLNGASTSDSLRKGAAGQRIGARPDTTPLV